MNLRDYARGQPCQVRLPGCDGGGETTVLAHARIIGVSGMGLKAPDILAAHCCGSCHSKADTDHANELDFLRGVMRTQALLVKKGVLKW